MGAGFSSSGSVTTGGSTSAATVGATFESVTDWPEESDDVTQRYNPLDIKTEPVVGWLVCISGPEKGKDFRIYGKNNTVGRSEKMDICIKGDTTISRENHARLAYDEKHNAFHLIPAESTNTIYLNDEPVYVPAKLTARDIIEFGDCKLMFVPLCDDNFSWKNLPKSGE